MMTRAPLLLAAVLLVACESTTTPDPSASDPDVLVDEVITALDAGAETRDQQTGPVLHRLLRHALRVVVEDHGADAARSAASRLRALAQDVRVARAAGDRAAYQDALLAFETAEAQLVVRVLGDAPVIRILRSDTQELEALRQRAERLEAAGMDARRVHRILRATVPDFRTARQAFDDGDLVTALRLGARVYDLLVRARS